MKRGTAGVAQVTFARALTPTLVASGIARKVIITVVTAGLTANAAATGAPSQSKFDPDVFGIGINFDEICDLHSGAPIGDKCYGFIGAVIEIVKSDSLTAPQFRTGPKACIPRGQNIPQIFEKIRPSLRARVGICLGFCTQTGYVISSLNEAYPCAN